MKAKKKEQTRDRIFLSVIVKTEGQKRELLKFYPTPQTTLGEISQLEDLLNKMAAPAKFEVQSGWEKQV